jgi:hypothetical protein
MSDDPATSPLEAAPALGELVRASGRDVLATLARWTGDLALAEDAVQDASLTALQVWSRGGGGRPPPPGGGVNFLCEEDHPTPTASASLRQSTLPLQRRVGTESAARAWPLHHTNGRTSSVTRLNCAIGSPMVEIRNVTRLQPCAL